MALLAIPLAAILAGQAQQRLLEMREQIPAEESLLYLPPPDRLGSMSLGYREALADFIWLRAVVFAGTMKNGQKIDWLHRYVSTINYLSPQFRRPYLWGGVVTIYNGQEIDRAMLDQSVEIFREGLGRFPEDHELLFSLGMILYRDYQAEAKNASPEELKALKAEGAKLIRKAAAFGAPPLIRRLAASLEAEGSEKALQAEFFQRQLLRADDEALKRLLRRKLKALMHEQKIADIEKLRSQFNQAHQDQLPYTAPALFAVLELPSQGEDLPQSEAQKLHKTQTP